MKFVLLLFYVLQNFLNVILWHAEPYVRFWWSYCKKYLKDSCSIISKGSNVTTELQNTSITSLFWSWAKKHSWPNDLECLIDRT